METLIHLEAFYSFILKFDGSFFLGGGGGEGGVESDEQVKRLNTNHNIEIKLRIFPMKWFHRKPWCPVYEQDLHLSNQ